MSAESIRPSLAHQVKTHLQKIPVLVLAKRYVWKNTREKYSNLRRKYFHLRGKYFDFNRLNVCHAFPLFAPNSSGAYKDRAQLSIQTINQLIPVLSDLATSTGQREREITSITQFLISDEDVEAAEEIKEYFDKHGSDKSYIHNYQCIYGPILKNREGIRGVLEIGMGTNNTDVVSNMGAHGKPGASLRAFRDFLKSARIFGADVDKRILFQEERIKTFFVDQTDPATFSELGKSIPSDLDLVIDDGLHAPNANIQTLMFGLSKIRIGGWVVIEDIVAEAIPVWEVVSALLPSNYRPLIIRSACAIVFAVERLS